MAKFWVMTDFDGNGYVNNSSGDTILMTTSIESAQTICDSLNTNKSIYYGYKAEAGNVKTILKKQV